MSETGKYMYAISRSVPSSVLNATPGLDHRPLQVIEHRKLSAVVSDVDLDEYGEDGLRRNLERMEWLEETARTHDTVVQALAQSGPVAPLRLATICLDDRGVRARLDEWYLALEQVLDRVAGRMEWSVKVLNLDTASASAPAPVRVEGIGSSSGAGYLQRKKAEVEARERSAADAASTAEAVHAQLAELAVASRRLPAQDPRLTGHRGTMLLNAAYLVEIEAEASFEAGVQALAARHPGVLVSARGPWPPYSFAMLEQR
jgi:hypothetical protein